jgi:hypothetical protein
VNPKQLLLIAVALLPGLWTECWGAAPERTEKKAQKAEGRTDYDMQYQLHLPTFADLLVAKIRTEAEKELQLRQGQESAEDFEIRQRFSQALVNSLCRTISELEDIQLGWQLDRSKKRTGVDLNLRARKGSELDTQWSQIANQKSAFAGMILPGAAFQAQWVGRAAPSDTQAYAHALDALRDKSFREIEAENVAADEKTIRKEITGKIFDVVRQTVVSGRTEGAASLRLNEDRLLFTAGCYVADGTQLEDALRPVAEFLQQSHPVFAPLQLNVAQIAGVNLHALAIPAPGGSDHDKFVKLFGERLDLVVGFGPQAIYFAAGRDALTSLRSALTAPHEQATASSPFEISLALKPIADFVAAMGEGHDQVTARQIADVLATSPGDSAVRLTTEVSKRRVRFRLELEEGIVQWLARVNPQARQLLLGE